MRETQIARFLTDVITVTTVTGVDEFGQPASTTVRNVRARVVRDHTRSRTDTGEEFTSTTQVATLHPLRVGDTLTVDGQERLVRAVKAAVGTRGGVTLTEGHL